MKLVFVCLALTVLALPAYATIVCKQIGPDPLNQEAVFYISGDTGAISYSIGPKITDLNCGVTMSVKGKRKAVCMRLPQREGGITVIHYSIDRLQGIATLNRTTFALNANLGGNKHYVGASSFMVECLGEL